MFTPKNKMKIIIDGDIHYVIYIDYNGYIPHTVHTVSFIKKSDTPYWRLFSWDAFANDGDQKDVRLYNSGSGGSIDGIELPQWADGYKGKFWVAEGIEMKGVLKNGVRLKNPKKVHSWYSGSSINPFKVCEIVSSMEYCEECGNESTEICWNHIYEDPNDNFELKYISDNSSYQ